MFATNEKVAPRGVTDPNETPQLPDVPAPLAPSEWNEEGPDSQNRQLSPEMDQRTRLTGRDLFHRGETLALGDDSPVISADPLREAALISADLNRSKEAMLRGCARLWYTWEMFEDDDEAKNRLVDALINLSVIGKADQRHGLDKSTISKMRKAGKWARALSRSGIIDRISAGYSVLYAAALLLEEMSGTPEERAAEMIDLFAGVKGGITRDFLERELKKRTSKPIIEQATAPNYDFGDGVDLLAMTPSESDWARIRSDHASADTLTRGLRFDQMGVVEAAMIVAPLREIPAAIKLLGCCGFEKMSHVLLTQSPPFADVIDATVVLTAERDQGHVIVVPPDWAESYSDPVNVKQIAEELAPSAKVKVHILALTETDEADGWTTIGRSNAWVEGPSVR